jgi:hypothetical protein
MPTVSTPRRNRRSRRKGANPPPVEREPSYVVIHASERELPPPDPATLPRDLLFQRERAYAICMAYKFEEWLVLLAARDRVPLDDCLSTIGILTIYVEAFLVAAATWPRLFAEQLEAEDDAADLWAPRTVADAHESGLTVVRKMRGRKPVPTLPGCHGSEPNGAPCQALREYGHKFCPVCERAELARIRAM